MKIKQRVPMTGQVTPQNKIMDVNRRLGNKSIQNQQGTTRILYDTLLATGINTLSFFKEANTRVFPLTNTGSFGNKLEAGESLVLQRMYLTVIEGGISGGKFVFQNIFGIDADNFDNVFGTGELDIVLANNIVIKRIPLMSFFSNYNKSAQFGVDPLDSRGGHNILEMDTLIVIPPLLDYEIRVRTESPLDPISFPGHYLRLTIEGVGSIINTRQTY
jgi:hypothetical protein